MSHCEIAFVCLTTFNMTKKSSVDSDLKPELVFVPHPTGVVYRL